MAISTGNRINFVYVSNGTELPESPDDSTVYYLAEPQQIYVGSKLMSDVTDYSKIESDFIKYDTTAGWSSQITLVSVLGCMYIYTDYAVHDGQNIPGFKFGDGNSYVVDLPFSDALDAAHRADSSIHVTASEKSAWNNKVRCYIDIQDNENLIFTTN